MNLYSSVLELAEDNNNLPLPLYDNSEGYLSVAGRDRMLAALLGCSDDGLLVRVSSVVKWLESRGVSILPNHSCNGVQIAPPRPVASGNPPGFIGYH